MIIEELDFECAVDKMIIEERQLQCQQDKDILVHALVVSTRDEQITILEDYLYPMVDELEHHYASEITELLLEMDTDEVLNLLEDEDALKAEVSQAKKVLEQQQKQECRLNQTEGKKYGWMPHNLNIDWLNIIYFIFLLACAMHDLGPLLLYIHLCH